MKAAIPIRLMALMPVLAGTLAFGLEPAKADPSLLPVKTRTEVLLPPDSDGLAWRYDMRMADFAGSVAGLVYEFNTPALMERRIRELREQRINTIVVNGLHFHNAFLAQWPQVTDHVKRVTEIAHHQGMKVIFHHDVPVMSYNGQGLQELIAHPDWLQRDIEFDRPTLRSYCIVNPDFRQAYFDRMTTFARATDIDGVMLDEVCFVGKEFCGCAHCRKAFTEITGRRLPRENTSEVFYNMDDPVWLAWLQWRMRAVGDWWVAMRKTFQTVKRDFCIMTYNTHGGFIGARSPLELGTDLAECARACDFVGTEIMTRNVYDSYRPVFAFRKAMNAYSDLYEQPVWGLVYHLNDPNFAYFAWAMNHMHRHPPWMATIEGENMQRYLDWPDRMQSRFARPESDVAILYSADSRNFGRIFNAPPDIFGISQCLTDEHIQHDFLFDADPLQARKLARYPLLILASVGNLSAPQSQAIREYVQDGGVLLATAHSSLLNETGGPHPNFQLADMLGVDYVTNDVWNAPRAVRLNDGTTTIAVSNRIVCVTPRPGAQTAATFLNAQGQPYSPAMVKNRYGQGRCVYLAFQPGTMNYEPEQRCGDIKTFVKNRLAADLLTDLVREAGNDSFRFKAVAVPEKVLLAVYRQEHQGKRQWLVHMLNATGAGIEPGTSLPKTKDWQKMGGPFPALSGNLIFDLRIEAVAQGRIVSPDYPEARPIGLEKRTNGYWRVTVNKDDLKAYAIVYLDDTTPPEE